MKKALATKPKIDDRPVGGYAPIEKIVATENERTDFEGIEELAESITTRGMLQPLVVRPLPDGTLKLIAGERRYRAAMLAGWQIVPVVYSREADDEELADLCDRAIENFQRKSLHPLDEAAVCVKLRDKLGDLAAVSRIVGRGERSVYQTIQLLELSESAQSAFRKGAFTSSHAELLVRIPHEDQDVLAARMLKSPIPVAELDRIIKSEIKPPKLPKSDPAKSSISSPTPPTNPDGSRKGADPATDQSRITDHEITPPSADVGTPASAGGESERVSPTKPPAPAPQGIGPAEGPAAKSTPAEPGIPQLINEIREFNGDARAAFALVWKWKDRWGTPAAPEPGAQRPAPKPKDLAEQFEEDVDRIGAELLQKTPKSDTTPPVSSETAITRQDDPAPAPAPKAPRPKPDTAPEARSPEPEAASSYCNYGLSGSNRSWAAQYGGGLVQIYEVATRMEPTPEQIEEFKAAGYALQTLAAGEFWAKKIAEFKAESEEQAWIAADAWHETEKARSLQS